MAEPDPLARIDRAIAELQAIRAELADHLCAAAAQSLRVAGEAADEKGCTTVTTPDDDLAPEHLLDTTSAAARFNYDRHTLARWCREEAIGVRRGGRWLVSIPRLQRHLNGGG